MHKSPIQHFNWGGYYQNVKGHVFPMHEHKEWELVYYLEGSVECVQGKRRFPGESGSLWLTPPHTQHQEIARTDYRNLFLALEAPANTPWPTQVSDDPERNMERLCRAILQEVAREKRDEVLIQLMTQELFHRITMSNKSHQATTSSELVRRAEAVFFASLDQSLSIAETARRIGSSPSNLRRAFQQFRGQSPRDCLRQLRCQQAHYWLQNSSHSLETIADLSGFDSASHLSRVLLKETGQRPGKLRGAQASSVRSP